MSKRKPRKSPYIQPPHEVANKKARADGNRKPRKGERPVKHPRSGRPIEPPSLRRSLRRAPIAFVAFFVLQYYVGGEPSGGFADTVENWPVSPRVAASLSQALFFAILFVPLSLFMDRLLYRSFTKRLQASGEATERDKRAAADDSLDDEHPSTNGNGQ